MANEVMGKDGSGHAKPAPSPSAELLTCEVCGARVVELRRGRCWGCYQRWVDSRPVGVGAVCVICSERRRANLKLVELLGSWVPLCHNCATATTHMMPMPATLDDIRTRLLRERRQTDRRVGAKEDGRVFKRERRGLERRADEQPCGDGILIVDEEDAQVLDELGPAEPRVTIEETICHTGPVLRTL